MRYQMFEGIGKMLILLGTFIIVLGVLFIFWEKIPFLGKLPGDIVVKKKNFGFFFPLTTCLLISAVVTIVLNLILWLLHK